MSKKEIWKTVAVKGRKNDAAFVVSSHGRFGIKDPRGKIEVRDYQPQNGRRRVTYRLHNETRRFPIYREVAKAFVKRPSSRHTMIIRKDHDYFNDHPSNLAWVTPAGHRRHTSVSPANLKARREKAIVKSLTARVLDEKKALAIKKMIWDPERKLSYREIAGRYGVSEMQIYRIKRGELWFHVKADNEPEHPRYRQNLKNLQKLNGRRK
jgi:DNA-directed RNA polymerase specialized sigma subunit